MKSTLCSIGGMASLFCTLKLGSHVIPLTLSETSMVQQLTVVIRDLTVTGVMVNHGKIPNGEGYRLSFNYHGIRHSR